MLHKFLVVLVKKLLKSVHIYQSYRHNKPGVRFFGTPGGMMINAVGQIIEKVISKMATGSHFEFWPLAKLAHTFARVTLTNFSKQPSKITNPCRNLCPDSTVTKVPGMTQLLSFHALSLLMRLSSVSAITTRSSTCNKSHGKVTQKDR